MPTERGSDRTIIAETNGHKWAKAFGLVVCLDCGIVRRADDKNSQCKGKVKLAMRAENK